MAGEKEPEQQQQPEPQQEPVQQEQQQQQQQQADEQPQQPPPQQASSAAPSPSSQRPVQPPPPPAVHKMDYEQDVVYHYGFVRTPVMPCFSPFGLKVETWLRAAGIKYENMDHRCKYRSKKGQLPFVELNGKEVADSAIIVREVGKYFDKDLDSGLTADQRAVSHAFSLMLDHHTGWVYRWWWYNNPADLVKATKVNLQHLLNSRIPTPILKFIFKLKMKGAKKKADAQGMGVHSAEEIKEFGKRDLLALNEFLGDKPFFFGEEPTLLDCVAFAHLVPMLSMSELKFELATFIQSECSHLEGLVERMKERFWPDWDEICKTLDMNTHLPKKEPEEKKEKEVDKEKSGNGTEEKDKESEPEKEKVEKDENEKEKEKELDDGDNKQKEGLEDQKVDENKKE